MPYLVASIMAVVAAMIILLTRYEADDSAITAEIERTKSMFITVDGFVNTYIQSGGDMTNINFANLYDHGILLGNIKKITDTEKYGVDGTSFASTLTFQNSKNVWQIVPIISGDTLYSASAGSGYKLFIDFSANGTLKSKDAFSESFLAREICENTLFGTSIKDAKGIEKVENTIILGGSASDSKLACIVFK